MPAAPWQILWKRNEHVRDKRIVFDEPTHTYTVDGSYVGWISTTGFVHSFFGHFDPDAIIAKMRGSPKWPQSKYFGMTDEAIKKLWSDNGATASEAGTEMHLAIEMYYNEAAALIPPHVLQTKEWRYFMNFVRATEGDIEPYRLEWEVFDTDIKLAGSIDAVFRRRSDGKFLIYDWKRSKEIKFENRFQKGLGPMDHLDDCNYWHYSLQLSIYKYILEKEYGMSIVELAIIILHPDQVPRNYKRIKLNDMREEVLEMVECRKAAIASGKNDTIVVIDGEHIKKH